MTATTHTHALPLSEDDRADLLDLLIRVAQREKAIATAASRALNTGHLMPAMATRQRALLDDATETAVRASRYVDRIAHGGLVALTGDEVKA